jgi:hypothetical protein
VPVDSFVWRNARGGCWLSRLKGFLPPLMPQPKQQELMLDLYGRRDSQLLPEFRIGCHEHSPSEKGPATCRAFEGSRGERAYFCCSLGLSSVFGGLLWVCCCGVAGAVAGFCSVEAEILTSVIVIFLHEKTKVEVSVPYVDVSWTVTNKSESKFIIN